MSDSRQRQDALSSHSRHLPPLPLLQAPLYFRGSRAQQWAAVLPEWELTVSPAAVHWLQSPWRGPYASLSPGFEIAADPDVGCYEGVGLGQVKGYPGNHSVYSVACLCCSFVHSLSVWNSLNTLESWIFEYDERLIFRKEYCEDGRLNFIIGLSSFNSPW